MDEVLRSSNRRRCRISVITTAEQRWLDCLTETTTGKTFIKNSFTAKEACVLIKNTPTGLGTTRRHIPNHVKLNYVLRKSKSFIMENPGSKKTNEWLYVGDCS